MQINGTLHDGPAIGLDWFLLDLFLMALIYVPLERLWPQYPKQGTFRNEWTLDVVYFMSIHLPLQILSFCGFRTMPISVPEHADHRFRVDGDHDSGMMPITRSGMMPIS